MLPKNTSVSVKQKIVTTAVVLLPQAKRQAVETHACRNISKKSWTPRFLPRPEKIPQPRHISRRPAALQTLVSTPSSLLLSSTVDTAGQATVLQAPHRTLGINFSKFEGNADELAQQFDACQGLHIYETPFLHELLQPVVLAPVAAPWCLTEAGFTQQQLYRVATALLKQHPQAVMERLHLFGLKSPDHILTLALSCANSYLSRPCSQENIEQLVQRVMQCTAQHDGIHYDAKLFLAVVQACTRLDISAAQALQLMYKSAALQGADADAACLAILAKFEDMDIVLALVHETARRPAGGCSPARRDRLMHAVAHLATNQRDAVLTEIAKNIPDVLVYFIGDLALEAEPLNQLIDLCVDNTREVSSKFLQHIFFGALNAPRTHQSLCVGAHRNSIKLLAEKNPTTLDFLYYCNVAEDKPADYFEIIMAAMRCAKPHNAIRDIRQYGMAETAVAMDNNFSSQVKLLAAMPSEMLAAIAQVWVASGNIHFLPLVEPLGLVTQERLFAVATQSIGRGVKLSTYDDYLKHFLETAQIVALQQQEETYLKALGCRWVDDASQQLHAYDAARGTQRVVQLNLLLEACRRLPFEEVQWRHGRGIYKAVFALRAPHLERPCIDFLLKFQHRDADAVYDRLPFLSLGKKNAFEPVLRYVLAVLSTQGVATGTLLDGLQTTYKSYFMHGPNARALLELLLKVVHTTTLSAAQKSQMLQKIDPNDAIAVINMLITLGQWHLVCRDDMSATTVFQTYLEGPDQALDLPGMDLSAVLQTFGQSRQPYAIWQYYASVQQTNDAAVKRAFQRFFLSVINGSFGSLRYALKDNPQLQHTATVAPGLLETWRQPLSPVQLQGSASRGAFNVLPWLSARVMNQHLGPYASETLLKGLARLGAQHGEAFLADQAQALSAATAVQATQAERIAELCLELVEAVGLAAQQTHLSALLAYFTQETIDCEFKNDVSSQLEQLKRGSSRDLRLIDTDRADDLLLCGHEVAGSCQRLDGNPQLNKGLLGYLLHGQVRLLSVVQPDALSVARNLLRLLWCKAQQTHVLFLEPLYGDEAYAQDLEDFAIAKARAARLPLVSLTPHNPTKRIFHDALEALAGPAPFEYIDAVREIRAHGIFTLPADAACKLLFAPASMSG